VSDIAACLSSAKMDWQTPDNVLELVREFGRGVISLDPCTVADNPTGALRYYTPDSDGLSQPWDGPGLVFCNPPYGRELGPWAWKMRTEATKGAEIIGLVPARTDTRWWHDYVASADAVLFWRGRLKFKGASASAPFPSALPYWGPRPDHFAYVFRNHGLWVRL
jgi:phage N-6-adenine-methyltransferase